MPYELGNFLPIHQRIHVLLLLILLLPQPPTVLEVLQLSHWPSPSSSCLLKMRNLLSHLLLSCIVSSSKQDK
jgi:hypothetical protein